MFGDDLFVRTQGGVQPTPRALALRAPLAEALRLIQATIRPVGFDAARDEHVFRIAASDDETSLFAPLLLDEGRGLSRFIFRTLVRRGAIDALRAGDTDLSPSGAALDGIVDKALNAAGASRRVVAAVPSFLAALATVARSDFLATVPTRVANIMRRASGS